MKTSSRFFDNSAEANSSQFRDLQLKGGSQKGQLMVCCCLMTLLSVSESVKNYRHEDIVSPFWIKCKCNDGLPTLTMCTAKHPKDIVSANGQPLLKRLNTVPSNFFNHCVWKTISYSYCRVKDSPVKCCYFSLSQQCQGMIWHGGAGKIC